MHIIAYPAAAQYIRNLVDIGSVLFWVVVSRFGWLWSNILSAVNALWGVLEVGSLEISSATRRIIFSADYNCTSATTINFDQIVRWIFFIEPTVIVLYSKCRIVILSAPQNAVQLCKLVKKYVCTRAQLACNFDKFQLWHKCKLLLHRVTIIVIISI